jgi:hypothetical protein
MKLTWLFILAFSGALLADPAAKPSRSKEYEEKKYWYSALNEFFKETYNKTIYKDDLNKLEELLYYTGVEILEDYDPKMLDRFPSSSTRFILGRQALREKKLDRALQYFDKVHPDHRYYPESKLLESHVYAQKGDQKAQFAAVEKCQAGAEKLESNTPEEKIKRYFRMVYEICLVNKARHHFKVGEYQQSIDAYNRVPKKSYKWPYLLLEKAWVYYQMGDYNRALGLLVTYKSPLLDTYFFPEAEYLAALAYFRLCLYEDSLTIINQYYQYYRPRFNSLAAVLAKHKNTRNYFYDLMFKQGSELKNHEEFVRHIITRLKKQTRFSLDFNTVFKITKEIRLIQSREKPEVQRRLLGHLANVRENMITKINYNAKQDIFEFLQSVPFYSSELFKLNLEIIARKKDLVYGGRRLVSDRSRGDYSNVKRTRFEQFWKFHGAFWADELGDYSLGLKSNCETIRNEPEPDASEGDKE